MLLKNYYRYEDQACEVIINKNHDAYFKDKNTNKYYFKKSVEFKGQQMDIKLLDFIYPIMIIIAVIGYSYFCYKYFFDFNTVDVPGYKIAIESTLFMIGNLVLHEVGHVLALKLYGRKLGKIRFRMNFIFPTISVDTSDSYILPRFRRLYVCASGLIVNSIILLLLVVFFERYIYIGNRKQL